MSTTKSSRNSATNMDQSPINGKMVAAQRNPIQDIIPAGDQLLWLKCMGEENGRLSLHTLPRDGNNSLELTPTPYNNRSKVHEYGGSACLYAAEHLIFCNFSDQQLYRIPLTHRNNGTPPVAEETTSPPPQENGKQGERRYADLCWDAPRQRIICVMEEHSARKAKPTNTLVTIDPENGHTQSLESGADFYASPRLSPCGTLLCWLSWNHPYMPWDSTYLHVAHIQADGTLADAPPICGGEEESIIQPQWGQDGSLYYVSDRNGWWNLYQYRNGNTQNLLPCEREFGKPMWVLGQHTYDFNSNGDLYAAYSHLGQWYIAVLPEAKIGKECALNTILGPYPEIRKLYFIDDTLYFLAGQTQDNDIIYRYTPVSKQLETALSIEIDKSLTPYFSAPQFKTFHTKDDTQINGFYYPPRNPHIRNIKAPPLIIKTHGGPTSCASSTLDLSIQFWTSRGFAVFDLNYRGSTGFGRDFRKKLYGNWGVFDVEDCIATTEFLIKELLAHPKKLIIRGSSAGGYTTLAALTFGETFHAGASYYGISDLKALAQECHKFESFYVQKLVHEMNLSKAVYQMRSPLFHIGQMSSPVIFFQGAQDKVVPPNQAQTMVNALKEKGIQVAYIEFAEEAHGFRHNENIETALNAELDFYMKLMSL